MSAATGHDEVILFDLFGTLVEYEPNRQRIVYPETLQLVQQMGGPQDHETFLITWDAASAALERASASTLAEFTMLDAAQAFAVSVGLEPSPDQVAELAARFLAEWKRHVRAVDGICDLIAALAGSYRLGVVSNTHDPDMVPSMLRSMGVAEYFEVVLLSVSHGYRKPHPSIYQVAMERMGCGASAIAFVGDSYEADYLGPRRAGMRAYLIDPKACHRIPEANRLESVLALPERLAPFSRA